MLLRPTTTDRKPRSTKVPRDSGSPTSRRPGNRPGAAPQRLDELHPGQRRADAEVQAGAEGEVRVGVAVRTSKVSASANTAGSRLAAPSRAAIFCPGSTVTSADRDVLAWRCARRAAAAESKRSISSTQVGTCARSSSRPLGAGSIATRPLPNTLTDASWPALSSRTAEATSSSSVSRASPSCAATRSETRSSPGSAARSGDELADVVGELGGRAHRGVLDVRRRAPTRTSARWPATRRAAAAQSAPGRRAARRSPAPAAARRTPRSRRSRPGPPRRAASAASSRTRGRSRSTWPRLKAPTTSRRSRVCVRRLVLHHLVAVQQVERLEPLGRLPVAPDPAEPAVAQHRVGAGVVEGEVRRRWARATRPRRAGAPRRRAGRGRPPTVGGAVRSHRVERIGTERVGKHLAHRPHAARRSAAAAAGRRSRTAPGGSGRTA